MHVLEKVQIGFLSDWRDCSESIFLIDLIFPNRCLFPIVAAFADRCFRLARDLAESMFAISVTFPNRYFRLLMPYKYISKYFFPIVIAIYIRVDIMLCPIDAIFPPTVDDAFVVVVCVTYPSAFFRSRPRTMIR